jgi:coatomer protein complex subunit alpha (xenin)
LYAGNVRARIQVLCDVGQHPLAYLTAQTNGLTDLAAEILASVGMTEEDVDDVPKFEASTLKLAPVITPTHQFNWPTISTGESFFEKALASGQVVVDKTVPQPNGDVEGDALDEWSREDTGGLAEEAETADEGAWDVDDGAPELPEDVQISAEGETTGATPGISEAELWTRNSPFAGDHVAAGSFETAMQLLNRQVAAVNFTPLKSHFLSIYRSSHAALSVNPSLPPLQVNIRRNPDEASPTRVLPVVALSLQAVKNMLTEAYGAVAGNKLEDAATMFRSILLSLLLVVVTTDEEAVQLQETIASTREYLLGMNIELERRRIAKEEPKNLRRNLELAAYFAHCKMQPQHLRLVLRNTMRVFAAAKCHATAAKFARRLIDLKPDPKMLSLARSVITEADRQPRDAIEISYDEFTEFDICAASYTPIYKGSPSAKDPFTGATFLPEYKGKLCPLTDVTVIGATASGLPSPR